MITRRVVVNLVAFAVVTVVLVGYGVFDLLGNPFAATTTVSTVLPSASGLAPNFSVTYDGIDVGSVASVSLVRGGARVVMTIDAGAQVPASVAAKVVIGNALGEQEVELVPRPGGTTSASGGVASGGVAASRSGSTRVPYGPVGRATVADVSSARPALLRQGEVLPVAPDSAPATVGAVVGEATAILRAVPAGSLNSLLHQAAVAVAGQADNLKTLASASELFASELLSYQPQVRSLLANAPPVLNTVTADAAALQQSLAETAAVVSVLAAHRDGIVGLLNQGSAAARILNAVVVANRPNLGCLVHDLAATATNLSQPANISNLNAFLEGNGGFFSIVQQVAPPGPAAALTVQDHARPNQTQLRVHLLLPPLGPSADLYPSPHGLTPIRPGAGCVTEFGAGVGPALQSDFAPAAGGTVVAPSAADAQVRGGGPIDPLVGASAASAAWRASPTAPGWPMLVVAAGAAVGGGLFGRRRRRRSARAWRSVRAVPARAGERGRIRGVRR